MINLFQNALAGVLLAVAAGPAMALELIMVHQVGCHYCQRWTEEIGPIYPNTAEGRHAPLRRVQLGTGEMDGLAFDRRVTFTPTFVLVDDAGTEMARLEGYPGEDFFWGLLGRMLVEKTGFVPDAAGGR